MPTIRGYRPSMADSAPLPRAETLEQLLDLEELDRDLYRAHNPRRPFTDHLYGGQVAAQALRAAGLTVPEGRHPHSMHCYYLRAGEAEHPTIMKVSRDRDGRSFSARRVEALQRGKAIFTMAASFHVDEESGDWSGVPMRTDVPSPEELDTMGDDRIRSREILMDLRAVDPPTDVPEEVRASRWMWARTNEPLPDDRVLHAAAIAYLSDMSSGFVDLDVPGLPRGGSSLDHTVYFHRPARADEWMFMALEPVSAAGARGVYRGSVHDRDGRLLATLVQENLMREWPSQRAPM
jgi:acyl-CoA thioesterase-2